MSASKLQCSICMDSFKNPKLISCHHSFCHKCLENHVRANIRNGHFNCPLCRESVKLPREGVSDFKTNFYIDTNPVKKIAKTDSGEKFACDLCGPKHVACSRCLVCEENLCQSCCYGHEKSKASRYHKIRDLGMLDSETKGKIRQRTFCDRHPEEEIKLVCQDCKVPICFMCKVVKHENHATKSVADAAAEMKKTIQKKMNECSDKLRRINASKAKGDELDRSIDYAEREELRAIEDQRSRLNKVLDQEVAKVKARIKNVYHNLRQQNAVFKRDVQNDFNTCSNAKENAQTLADQGTDIEIIKKGPNVKQNISAAISKTDQTPNVRMKNKLFSPAEIKPSEVIALIGIMQDSTNSGRLISKHPATTQSSQFQGGPYFSFVNISTFQPTAFGPLQQPNDEGRRFRKKVKVNTNEDLSDANKNEDLSDVNTNEDLSDANTNEDLSDVNTNEDLSDANTNEDLSDVNTNEDLSDRLFPTSYDSDSV